MELRTPHGKTLFGATHDWNAKGWIASDDRVRGGNSKSHLNCDARQAAFCGNLDIKTLGGAGFASQRTCGGTETWDLHTYDGIELEFDASDSDQKVYTFILKDHIPYQNPENGRERASLSWEVDFSVSQSEVTSQTTTIFFKWEAFEPTYRGKKQSRKHGPDLRKVKRFSIMMRSFFGTQEGEFRLILLAVRAVKATSEGAPMPRPATPSLSTVYVSGPTESPEKEPQSLNEDKRDKASL